MAYRIADKVIFNHLPKTGGTWVTATLPKAGVKVEKLTRKKHEVVWGEVSFVFVRNPLSWVRSVYAWKLKNLKKNINRFVQVWDPDLDKFVVKFYKRHGAFLTNHYLLYTSPPKGKVCYVGKQEFLTEHLIFLLDLFGIQVDKVVLRSAPRKNAAPDFHQIVGEESANLIRQQESKAFEMFYPNVPFLQDTITIIRGVQGKDTTRWK